MCFILRKVSRSLDIHDPQLCSQLCFIISVQFVTFLQNCLSRSTLCPFLFVYIQYRNTSFDQWNVVLYVDKFPYPQRKKGATYRVLTHLNWFKWLNGYASNQRRIHDKGPMLLISKMTSGVDRTQKRRTAQTFNFNWVLKSQTFFKQFNYFTAESSPFSHEIW